MDHFFANLILAQHTQDAAREPVADPLQVVVDGFSSFGGLHCETSALRKLLAFQGIDFSEEMLFGLGGGIGLVFWRTPADPIPFVGGRNGRFPDFLRRAAAALGHKLRVVRTQDKSQAYALLRNELNKGIPAICYGDIHFLPYFQTDRHFGGHAFVVYGLQEEHGHALVSDRSQHPRRVPLGALAQARASATKPFPPNNALLQLRINPTARLTEAAVWDAIDRCRRALQQPLLAGIGLRGLRTFGEFLKTAAESLPRAGLLKLLISTYVNLELAGTGGAAFRNMYRRFLAELRQLLIAPELDDAIVALDRARGRWDELIAGLLPDTDDSIAAVLRALQEKERVFLHGDEQELAASARSGEDFARLLPAAAAALDRQRRQLVILAELCQEIRAAETTMCTALQRASARHQAGFLRRLFAR